MKYNFLHIICWSVLFTCMSACNVLEEPEVPPCNEDNAEIVFTLALENPVSSRNSWDPNDTDDYPQVIGNRKDNRIVPKQLHVVLYKKDNTYLCKVMNLVYRQLPVTGSTVSNKYQFVGDVPASVLGTNNTLECKIMVFANVPESQIPTTAVSTLEDIDFSYSTTNIPMWGVASFVDDNNTTDVFEGLTLTPGSRTDIGTIYILRAMAKIKVKLAESFNNYNLDGVKINRYNTKGYVLPSGYATANVTTALPLYTTGSTTGVLRPNTTVTSSESLDFTPSEDNDGSLTIYVPEYQNIGVKTPSTMTVTLADPNDNTKKKDYPLEFKWYEAEEGKHAKNEPFDLIRNHYYEYTITGVNNGNTPSLTVSVENWDLNQETLSFQDYVSVGKDGQIAWFEGNNTEGIPITPVKSNSGDKAYVYSNTKDGEVTCKFNISTPVGGTWYASLIGSGEDAFAFKFSDASQLGTDDVPYASHTATMATGKVGMGPITLTIKTVSDRPKLVNNEAILQIYVETYDRRTIAVKELLNQADYSGIDMCTLIQTID